MSNCFSPPAKPGVYRFKSRTFAIPQLLLAQGGHDVRLSQQSNGTGHNFRRYGLTLTSGMTLTFTTADFVAGTSHHQSITIQNRSGVNFASVHIKPSASPEWDTNSFGTLSNNSNMSASVPIPPSNFSVFDIQARSVNPANTYTINNVTVSDGTTVLFTSANADNPPMGFPVIVIQNNTGYGINGIWIRTSTSTDWGSNLWGWQSLTAGQSRTFTLPQLLTAQSLYDIRLSQQSNGTGHNFIRSNITMTEGIVVTLTVSDLSQ